MNENILYLLVPSIIIFLVFGAISILSKQYNLDGIKSKTVGDGQHGSARWATKVEIRRTYQHIPFTPQKWRAQAASGMQPTLNPSWVKITLAKLRKKPAPKESGLPQGIVVGCKSRGKNTTALVDTGDVHVLMIGAAGVGKTAYWLYPCIEYACASGMSFLTTDTNRC